MRERAYSSGLGVPEDDYPDLLAAASSGAKRCNCKKARCLKLYCVCFAAGVYCSGCACRDCTNTLDNQDLVLSERNKKLQQSPGAFAPKVEQKAEGELAHKKGCRCRRSRCIKKYCECFDAQVFCSTSCRCDACQNQPRGGAAAAAAIPHVPALQPLPMPLPLPLALSRTASGQTPPLTAAGTLPPPSLSLLPSGLPQLPVDARMPPPMTVAAAAAAAAAALCSAATIGDLPADMDVDIDAALAAHSAALLVHGGAGGDDKTPAFAAAAAAVGGGALAFPLGLGRAALPFIDSPDAALGAVRTGAVAAAAAAAGATASVGGPLPLPDRRQAPPSGTHHRLSAFGANANGVPGLLPDHQAPPMESNPRTLLSAAGVPGAPALAIVRGGGLKLEAADSAGEGSAPGPQVGGIGSLPEYERTERRSSSDPETDVAQSVGPAHADLPSMPACLGDPSILPRGCAAATAVAAAAGDVAGSAGAPTGATPAALADAAAAGQAGVAAAMPGPQRPSHAGTSGDASQQHHQPQQHGSGGGAAAAHVGAGAASYAPVAAALLHSPGVLLQEPEHAEQLARWLGLAAPQQLAARKAAHILRTMLQMAEIVVASVAPHDAWMDAQAGHSQQQQQFQQQGALGLASEADVPLQPQAQATVAPASILTWHDPAAAPTEHPTSWTHGAVPTTTRAQAQPPCNGPHAMHVTATVAAHAELHAPAACAGQHGADGVIPLRRVGAVRLGHGSYRFGGGAAANARAPEPSGPCGGAEDPGTTKSVRPRRSTADSGFDGSLPQPASARQDGTALRRGARTKRPSTLLADMHMVAEEEDDGAREMHVPGGGGRGGEGHCGGLRARSPKRGRLGAGCSAQAVRQCGASGALGGELSVSPRAAEAQPPQASACGEMDAADEPTSARRAATGSNGVVLQGAARRKRRLPRAASEAAAPAATEDDGASEMEAMQALLLCSSRVAPHGHGG